MSEMFSGVFKRRYFRWIDRRNRAPQHHILTRKNLFIFPSAMGFFYLLITLVVWLLGTNYQNNLILALAFFMIGLLIVSIHHTFLNLNNIEIEYLGAQDAFAGDLANIRLAITTFRRKKNSESITFFWQSDRDLEIHSSFDSKSRSEITLPIQTHQRGRILLPRLGLYTVFPLRLIRCWSWLRLEQSILVYPKPIVGELGRNELEDDDGDQQSTRHPGQDFSHLKEHDAADGLRHVYWKALARGQGLLVKQHDQSLSNDIWIDFDSIATNSIEDKLSIMCFWVLEYQNQAIVFGLRLPGQTLEPGSGALHCKQCLSALAMYGTQSHGQT
jgi:uncharacterized protein (DUF58 family)